MKIVSLELWGREGMNLGRQTGLSFFGMRSQERIEKKRTRRERVPRLPRGVGGRNLGKGLWPQGAPFFRLP
jgi:hypothetical protein